MESRTRTIYTIGHSTRPIEEFIEILKHYQVSRLIDIRTIPKSRFNPQFNEENLSRSLFEKDISYERMAGLGGLRHAQKNSINLGWRNASFRGYADYMQTEEFKVNLRLLMKKAEHETVAIMCAEAVPWKCHRSLVADALFIHGFLVKNIMNKGKADDHKLNKMAEVHEGSVAYPRREEE